MMKESSSNKIWAKLIEMNHGEGQNIALTTDRTEGLFDNKVILSQNQDGDALIKNISASSVSIDDSLLAIHQEKKLFGGERLSFSLSDQMKQKFNYVFCLVNFRSSLKRDRDEVIECQSLEKLTKIGNDFQKELACSICTNPLQECMILTPCQHTLCGSCLFHQLQSSSKCPLCRVEAVSVTKNPLLSNLVQLAVNSFPFLKRSQDGKKLEEINFGGVITRNKEGVYVGSLVKNQRDGLGKLIEKDGAIYEGSWKNGQREGKGVEVYASGDKYDGSWMNDHYHGMGKYTWEDGGEYEGEFRDGDFTSYGTMKYADGKIYKGKWKGNDEEGHGILTLSNGDQYEGEWIKGVLQPKVKIDYSNGEKYEGEIETKSFKKHGKGILIMKNCDRYEGVWVDDMLQPQVKIKYSNGEVYVGEIEVKNFKKHGKGVFALKNGDQYNGYWMNDKQHGHGKEVRKIIFEGVWKEGKINGEVVMTDADGIKYQVEFKRLGGQTEKGSLNENKSQT